MKNLTIAILAMSLAGCGVELLTTTAIQGELQAQQLKTVKGNLDYAKEQSAEITLRNALNTYYGEKGRYPGSLSELVPEYLDHVPTRPDGTSFGYDPATGRLSDTPAATTTPSMAATTDDSQRLSQISAAIARYGQATGRYPTSLYALVPEYLPEVPKTASGQAFIYYPQNGALYHPAQLQTPAAPITQPQAVSPTPPRRAGVGGVGPMGEMMTGIGIQQELNSMSNVGTSAAQGRAMRGIDNSQQQHQQQQERALNNLGL
ncbi:MAG: hypothetical protein HY706_10780 [Candidatus Hydrogenedentes bacterium]|nr:hypothetical protein [Candidatus Hydrogenedentota bacterium]